MLRFQYESKTVEKYFSDYRLMKKKIGDNMTKAVKKRTNELRASNNFSVYLSLRLGNPHSLSGDLKGYYAVSVTGNYRLILKPVSDNLSAEALKNCSDVILKGVDEYHDGKNEWIIP